MRHTAGYVQLSSQMLEDARRADEAFRELEWIASHWEEATSEQRERFREWERRMAERDDEEDGW